MQSQALEMADKLRLIKDLYFKIIKENGVLTKNEDELLFAMEDLDKYGMVEHTRWGETVYHIDKAIKAYNDIMKERGALSDPLKLEDPDSEITPYANATKNKLSEMTNNQRTEIVMTR